jgi:hypothetical protein
MLEPIYNYIENTTQLEKQRENHNVQVQCRDHSHDGSMVAAQKVNRQPYHIIPSISPLSKLIRDSSLSPNFIQLPR